MESLSPQVVSATKLPILNPNEFDLWNIRIEQYFLMTDYSLCEVILNGDSPAPTRVVDGVLQPVAPTTAEHRLARKNELKARGSSTESLDQIHDRLQKLISQLEILGVSLSQEDINLKFLRSLLSEWRTHTRICRNKTDLEEQSLDDLFIVLRFMRLKLRVLPLQALMAMLIMRARQFLQMTGRNLRANRPTSMGFDMSKVECYNYHRKGHFVRECRSPKDTRRNGAAEPQRINVLVETTTSNALVSQCNGVGSYDWTFQAEEEPTNYALMAFSSSSSSSNNEKLKFDVISYQAGLESVEARLLVYKQNEYVFEEDIKLLKFEVQLRDNALVSLRQNLEKEKQEMDDLKLNDESLPPSLIYDRYQSGNGYHAVPPPYTGTFMPPKPDLVFNNAPNDVKTAYHAFTVKLSPTKPDQNLSLTNRPSTPIIEDWVSDSEDESEIKTPHNVPSFV
nr:hypothetical protein [Tanacetum cinerariifolium]